MIALAIDAHPFPAHRWFAASGAKTVVGRALRAGNSARRRLSSTRMGVEKSDEALMLAYADGDSAAFERLYGRHKNKLYGYLNKLCGDRASTDEAFQDTWLRVVDARARYRAEAPFGAWLYRIAHRLAIDLLRKRRPQVPVEDVVSELIAADPDPARFSMALEDQQRLRAALDELPHEQRAAILMQADEGMTLEQIAEVSECGRETVKSRLRYAMNRLRGALATS